MSIVEQELPPDGNSKWQLQPRYSLNRSGHCLFIFKSNITARDIADVSEETVRLALYEDGPVLFLLYKLGENEWEEVPFSWHTQHGQERIYLGEEVDSSFEYSFRIVLTEPSGGAAAVREFILDAGFADKLHDIIRRQAQSVFNGQSFGKYVNSVYNRIDVSDMVSLATDCFQNT